MAWYSHLFQNFPEFVVIHRVKGFSAVNEAEVDVLEFFYFYYNPMDVVASLVAQMVKCLPAMWETLVRVLGQEDPLEKEMAIHSSTFAWKILWTEKPDRLQSMGCQELDTTEQLHTQMFFWNSLAFSMIQRMLAI